jgi:hypothetical protein
MDARTIGAVACELSREGHLAQAETLFRHSLAEVPSNHEARINLAMAVLAQGRMAEGAQLYEARLASANEPHLPFPRWDGTPLDGKNIVIWPEQGLGDQIMVARYAKSLVDRGCTVTIVCPPTLERLFAKSLPANILPARGSIELPDADCWLWAMSLLAAMDGSHEPSAPYLFADPKRADFSIGVATRGSPTNLNDAHRSLDHETAATLLSLPDAGSLLPEDTGAADMLETAEIIAGLDLVIAVDTSIAHLAAALGKPVWILLPAYAVDWRWRLGRDDSPWYPSATLIRQPIPGDWCSVLRSVIDRLR